MSESSSIDMTEASHILDLQNGSNSLDSSTRVSGQTSQMFTSEDSGGETVNQYIQSPVIPVVNPYGPMVVMVSNPDSTDHQTTPTTPPSSSPTHETNLLTLLRNQLEYYFSKDNLATDKYLLSQMDSDHFVPVSVLANFNQVKRLSTDMNLIVEAIKDSSTLKLDSTETKVKAIPEKRCILILREIPKETPKEDVFRLFSGANCPKFLSCDFAENDCWYVTFSDEEEAQEAYRYLREEVRDFLGKPVRARIKNTTVQRATSLPKTRPNPSYNYSSVQPVQFYQQPVVWPPYYSEPSYTSPYVNGLPSHSGFPGGVPSQRFVSSTNNRSTSGSGASTSSSTRKTPSSSSSSSTNVKGRHSSTSDVSDRRIGNGGGSSFSQGGGMHDSRYRRDDERDRTRNLPNRFRKRNEERTGGNEDKQTVDKEKSAGNNRPRYQNKSQPKLDFAPASFPPLPGQSDSGITPLPPPLPPTSPEANLADIVKRRHGSLPLSITGSLDVMDIKTSVSALNMNEGKPLSPNATTSSKPVPPATQIHKTDSKASSSLQTGEKETSNPRHNAPRNMPSSRNQGTSGGRNRHRDSRKSSSNTTRNPKQFPKQVNSTNTASSTPAPTSTNDESRDDDKDELKSERKSYAQMAGKKMKPSTSSSSTSESVPLLNVPSSPPPVSPNDASSESDSSSPVSPLPVQTTSS
ncbi:PREDICTED: la-related protein 4-like [Amphimedon queenslandica]|uniref:HTH La-type RNA-binding domain-containing protein n=1 Tax=Amphimedon queenslandica TaxID=400682 RepID=A0A1X7UK61_AMPQE|nr:PREDICTED: la-related protein 4-like [Amphimedon queenslandica]|eukprot:XP_019853836.1 PREDICTED: la-related protein 4-like [Amphimedon queenslandica]